jgi:hypothetical protein
VKIRIIFVFWLRIFIPKQYRCIQKGKTMVTIEVNLSHPNFTGLDPKEITVVVGSSGQSTPFLNYTRYPVGTYDYGEPGTNPRILNVGGDRMIRFSDIGFALLGNKNDLFHANKITAPLIDYVENNVLIVKKDGVVMSVSDIYNFTP